MKFRDFISSGLILMWWIMTVDEWDGVLTLRTSREKRRRDDWGQRKTILIQFPSVAGSRGPTVWCSLWAAAHTPRNREGRSQCHSEVLCGHTEQRTRLRESKGLVSLEGQLWWVGKTQQRTSRARWRTGVRRCEYLHYPKSRRRGGHLNQPFGWELWLKEPTGTTPLRSNSPLCPQDKSHVQDVVVLRREEKDKWRGPCFGLRRLLMARLQSLKPLLVWNPPLYAVNTIGE